jgi:hypothetical protein
MEGGCESGELAAQQILAARTLALRASWVQHVA